MIEGRISPLRRRMIEDMNLRHFSGNTQETYIRAVEKLAKFLKRSPATSTSEDLRRFQLHLTASFAQPATINVYPDSWVIRKRLVKRGFWDSTLGHDSSALSHT